MIKQMYAEADTPDLLGFDVELLICQPALSLDVVSGSDRTYSRASAILFWRVVFCAYSSATRRCLSSRSLLGSAAEGVSGNAFKMFWEALKQGKILEKRGLVRCIKQIYVAVCA